MSEPTSYACPVCGRTHAHQSPRYQDHVCHECASRARCVEHDRAVTGYNLSPLGGFVAYHDAREDDPCDQVVSDGTVTVDGREFRMREARFGGVVVLPSTA